MDNLSTQLRDEYRKKLTDKGREWVLVPAFVVGSFAALMLLGAITGGGKAGFAGVAGVLIGGAIAAGAANYLWVAYRQKIMLAWPDDLLVHNYQEYQQARRRHRIWAALAVIVILLLVAMAAINDPSETALFLSSASCSVVGTRTHPDVFVVNGAPDAGYTVEAQIRNTGGAGVARINVTLSTSEGRFQRTQDLQLAAGETKPLSFGFSEPTINAANIQSSATCRP